MFRRRIFSAAIAVSLSAAPAAAQSLGDLARQEEGRRAATRSVKALTNSDLGPFHAVLLPEPDINLVCFVGRHSGPTTLAAVNELNEGIYRHAAVPLFVWSGPGHQAWSGDAGSFEKCHQ